MIRRTWSPVSAIAWAAAFAALAWHGASRAQEPLRLAWGGQSSSDRVGLSPNPGGNGINDLRITIKGDSLASPSPVQWSLRAASAMRPHLEWEWPPTALQAPALWVEPRGSDYDLFFEPYLSVEGDLFTVAVTFADGTTQRGMVAGGGIAWGDSAKWLGQGDRDFVGDGFEPNGCDDWMILVSDATLKPREIASWTVWLDYGGGDNYFHDSWGWDRSGGMAGAARALRAESRAGGATLYIDPALAREGDVFAIQAVTNDGDLMAWMLAGGGSDWGQTAAYYGRVAQDKIGEHEPRPNGVNDIQMEVFDAKLTSGVARCAVSTAGKRWEYPDGPEGTFYLMIEPRQGAMRITLENSDDQAGQFYFVSAVLPNGKMIGWSVTTSRTNNSSDADWLGQVLDVVGPGKEAKPDGLLDLGIRVRHPILGLSEVKSWGVSGGGRDWSNDPKNPFTPWTVGVDPNPNAGERTVYFSDAGLGAIRRGTKYTVTATLADGNVINWRLSSPGSPMLGAVNWERPTRTSYVLTLERPGFPIGYVSVASDGGKHTWSSRPEAGRPADAQVGTAGGKPAINLDRAKAGLKPGEPLGVEILDRSGVRHFGTCFIGPME